MNSNQHSELRRGMKDITVWLEENLFQLFFFVQVKTNYFTAVHYEKRGLYVSVTAVSIGAKISMSYCLQTCNVEFVKNNARMK